MTLGELSPGWILTPDHFCGSPFSSGILVLDKGQVVEYDTPGSLMDNRFFIFHDMCKEAGLLHKQHTHC